MVRIETARLVTELKSVLEQLTKGERFLLTEGGRPVAMIAPPEVDETQEPSEAVRNFKEWRRQSAPTLGEGLTIRQMIEEGRRF